MFRPFAIFDEVHFKPLGFHRHESRRGSNRKRDPLSSCLPVARRRDPTQPASAPVMVAKIQQQQAGGDRSDAAQRRALAVLSTGGHNVIAKHAAASVSHLSSSLQDLWISHFSLLIRRQRSKRKTARGEILSIQVPSSHTLSSSDGPSATPNLLAHIESSPCALVMPRTPTCRVRINHILSPFLFAGAGSAGKPSSSAGQDEIVSDGENQL